MADDESPQPTRAVLPAAASRALLALLIVSAALMALAEGRAAKDTPRSEGGAADAAHRNLVGAILTSRPLGPEGRPEAPASGPGSKDAPLRLRFVPSGDKAQTSVAIDALTGWLHDNTGYHVEGAILVNYGLVTSELALGRADVAFLTATSYARTWYMTHNNDDPDDDIEALVMVMREGSPEFPQSALAYRAALVVRSDSELRRTEDLTPGHTVAFGGRTSGAGSLLPGALFHRVFGQGKGPQIQRFTGGYKQIVAAVMQGKVDAGAVWWSPPTADLPQNDARIQSTTEYPEVFEQTRIIGYTGWIPNEPVVVRSALPREVKETLRRALPMYVALKRRTPEGRRELMAIGSMEAYIPVGNDSYAPLFATIEGAYAGDPAGLADFQRGSGG